MVFLSLCRRKGFTLFEMLLGLTIAIPLVYGATLLSLAIVRASVDEQVTASYISLSDGERHSLRVHRSPTVSVEAEAVAYHAVLSSKLSHSTATYLFGAENIGSDATLLSPTSPMQVGVVPFNDWLDLPVANTQRTAREFIENYEDILGKAGPLGSPDNFSLVVIGPIQSGEVRITALAQVVCLPAKIFGKGESLPEGTLQWARLWTAEGYLEYAWTMPARREGDQPWKPRASQYWLRVDESLEIYEPGLTVCRFPDPMSAIEVETVEGASFARFMYAL